MHDVFPEMDLHRCRGVDPDGSAKYGGDGVPLSTYTNEQITTFARVFTGFKERIRRDNIEVDSEPSHSQ